MRAIFFCLSLLFSLAAQADTAIFAGGCFWCSEADFEKVTGVTEVIAGYDGGVKKNPTYRQVSRGITRYREGVKVRFNPKVISYKALVNYFFKTIDVTQSNGQFCDIGHQYTSAIYTLNSTQKKIATQQLALLKKRFTNVATVVEPSTQFYPAENYHQNYYKKNPYRYKFYRYRCGRDEQLRKLWKKDQ